VNGVGSSPAETGIDVAFPPFIERAPWWGPDLQTLRNALIGTRRSADGPQSTRLMLPLDDGSGDTLSALLQHPRTEGGTPRALVVLIHGLSGSEDSAYMVSSAAHFLGRGYRVLRVNLRGAGPSRPLCRLQYHAGRTADLRAALRSVAAQQPDAVADGLFLVGYSLGANMMLKFLAEYGVEFPVVGAVSVSAPIDLGAASRRFLEPRNRVYHWNLLYHMKQECLAPGAVLSAAERDHVLRARSIYEYDDTFVGPRNGYANAEEYYAENMALRFLARVRHPTLVIHARDDPWIPAEAYTTYAWERNPALIPLLPAGGGHVGFHGRGDPAAWHDRCIDLFFDRLLVDGRSRPCY